MIRISHAPHGTRIFSHFLRFLVTQKICTFSQILMESSCTSQLKLMSHHVLHNKIMSDNLSCSSESNTFQMYQDFDILFGDPVPRRDQWDHSRIDWGVHVE